MKRTDFNKEIQIISLAKDKLLGLELKSILYTPNKYRIPVAFADRSNSADDTEKYISENYSKENQEKLKHNETINDEFLAKVVELSSGSEEEICKLAKEYKAKLFDIDYKAPDELRCLTPDDDIKNLSGYLVIDSNAILDFGGETIADFLNLNFDKFNNFFVFFTKYFGMFIDSLNDEDLLNLQIDELADIKLILSLAEKVYKNSKQNIIQIQNLFRKFVDFLYGYNNSSDVESLTLKQKFYVFYEENHKQLDAFSQDYYHKGLFNFYYSSIDLENLKHKSTTELIEKIRKFDADGSKISSSYSIITDNIYTVLYISLYNLVLNNSVMIRQCKNCHRYFTTNKSNTYYCDKIYYQNKTCKDVGNQLSQKRKETKEPAYGKYRSIYSKKATLLKRNPDIYSREDYEQWKKKSSQFMQDIRNGLKTYEEFDKWLDKNN